MPLLRFSRRFGGVNTRTLGLVLRFGAKAQPTEGGELSWPRGGGDGGSPARTGAPQGETVALSNLTNPPRRASLVSPPLTAGLFWKALIVQLIGVATPFAILALTLDPAFSEDGG